jgi:disulfide bond formation protein DsbB
MGLQYTVKKSKTTRIGYRILGGVFLVLGILGFALVWRLSMMRFFVIAVALVSAFYGIYLIRASLRLQAYDITYEFTEEHIKLQLHNGEKLVPYDEVADVQWIEPTPDLDYILVQITVGKQKFVLHFSNKRAYAEKVFAYLLERVPDMK